MARLKTASALLVTLLSRASALQYQLVQEYNASNIFEEFDFFSGPDPTGGFVQYVTKEVAGSTPLIGNSSDLIYIGVDDANAYTPGGVGRPSVRLQSKLTFTEGLFVIDLTHIPVGCGTWPALWTTGLNDWPADGEIDIIENVNDARANNAAIHATGDCLVDAATSQTGTWKSTDCSVGHDDNQGCGTVFTEPFNYGAEFNANGGGVYAMEWTSDTIKIWFFPPTNVPLTLLNGGVPDSATFGTPSSVFNGPCSGSFSEKFFNHSIIIDTTFCGGWAGGTFGTGSSSCPIKEGLSPQDSCIDFVANNPEAFKDAYWGIRSVKVWEKVPGFTVEDLATPGIALPPPGVALPSPVATIEPLDVLIKGPVSWNVSKPMATIEPLDVSPLTGGVLSAGDHSEDTLGDDDSEDVWDDDDITEDDLDNVLDAVDDFIDLGSLDNILGTSILDTEEPSGIIIDIDIGPATSDAAALLNQVATTLYGGGILDIPSVLPSPASILVPFGVGNTEGHKDLFPPELSLPVPTKGPRIPAPNGNTGIVPPHLQQLPPVRQQNPAPSSVVGVQIPNTLPLLLPQPVDNAAQTGLTPMQIDTPAVTAPEVAAPQLAAPVAIPQLNASALNVPTGDDPAVGVPPVAVPASGINPLLTPPQHSNPLIPAGIGNTGVVPPSISDSPIVSLWSSFGTELKNKLIAAATNLPPPSPGSSPLADLWASLSPELRSDVLNAAKNLPASTLENSVPTISDLINAASTGKVTSIPNVPGLPILDAQPAIKPAGGLLGFLDAKTKNKLKALLGQTAAPPTGGDDRKRQIPVPGSLAPDLVPVAPLENLLPVSGTGAVDSTVPNPLSQPVASNPRPLAGLAQNIVPNTLPQPVANNIQPLPGLSPGLVSGAPLANSGPGPILGLVNGTISNPLSQPVASNPQPLASLAQSNVPNTPPQSVEGALQQLPGLWNTVPNGIISTVSNALSQPVSPPLKLTPNVPVTALTSTDTTKAMNGLLSLLDDSTKNQIADLLFGPDSSTADVAQPAIDTADEITRRSDNNGFTRRQTTSVWSPQDKLALAQNVYVLCPIPALVGIPFPSPTDFAVDLRDPNKTLEDALANFQRKLQAYFDITVQGCWTKINQWLAWRQLLSKPGTSHILPYPFPKPKRTMRIQRRQKDNVAVEDSNPQGFVEQQIYTICPKPDTFSPAVDQLIADLKDENVTMTSAISKFQNKLWAYMAKMQECSDKIRQYGPKLKALSGTPPTKPGFHTTTGQEEVKRHHARQIPPRVVSATDLLDHLTKLQLNPYSFSNLSFEDKKSIYEDLLADTSAGWPGNPRDKEELQDLVFQLTQATAPQSWGVVSNGGSPGTVTDNGDAFPGSEDGDDTPPPSGDDSGNGGSDISLPVEEGGPDGGFDDGIDTTPGAGDDSTGDGSTDGSTGDDSARDENPANDGINGFAPGEPNPSAPDAANTDDGAGAGSDESNGVDLHENGDLVKPGDTGSDPSDPGNDPFAGSPMDDSSSGAPVDNGSNDAPVDDNSTAAPIDDGSQDTASVADTTYVFPGINTPSTAPPEDPIPADDTGSASETTPADEDTQGTATLVESDILPSDTTAGDANPAFDIEPPGFHFRSRILRSPARLKRQDQADANGVIPDTETPADLDAILGPHGTLDPFGFLGPQIASPPSPSGTQDPHDSPTAADDAALYSLPDTAVDEASPDVDAALQAGEQDPFGQLTYSKDDGSAEDAGERWESTEFLGKLRDHEESEHSGKYLGDPRDVDDFVDKFYQGDGHIKVMRSE